MRICVIVPSQGYLAQAGTRIRYNRLRDSLAALGSSLETAIIGDFRNKARLDHDVYILSKCNDARGVMMAIILKRVGKLVGIDLFDDYFSQEGDSRFAVQREWMRGITPHLDFMLCSTQRMRDVAQHYSPGVLAHVLNDPFGSFDGAAVIRNIESNLERALATRQVEIGWFGVGDNPYFLVGLRDLTAFGRMVDVWRSHGYTARLSILTNPRALTRRGLESLRRLPLPYEVEAWTEEGEQSQIAGSLFCFLPVNAQHFSIGKSLNRAVTAMTGGAQVLSAGYPLYAPLESFIYRDPLAMLRDVEARRPLIRAETLPDMTAKLTCWADPQAEAEALHGFLKRSFGERMPADVRHTADLGGPVLAMLHGRRSPGDCHKFAQGMGQFSVSSPFSSSTLNYDAVFAISPDGEGVDLLLSLVAVKRLAPAWAARVQRLDQPLGKRDCCIRDFLPRHSPAARASRAQHKGEIISPAAFYPAVMRECMALLTEAFPGTSFLSSETNAAFWVSPRAPQEAGRAGHAD